MPISAIRFGQESAAPEAWDIHLLRGQSIDGLRKLLWVSDAGEGNWKSLAKYEENNHDIDVEFSAVFNYQRDEDELEGFGIHVNRVTGRVRTDGGAPPDKSPANFLVEGFVTRNDGGISWLQIPNALLRIHLHRSVTRVWLTPSQLSVRRTRPPAGEESTGYAFTVRAQFDDDTVGDVTYSKELTFTPAPWFTGNRIRIPADAPNIVPPFTVTVTTSAKWNSRSAEAKVEVLPPWSTEPNMPRAELVDGAPGVWDGTLPPENVPNVLFVGCGFSDVAGFRAVTNEIVHRMNTDAVLQPFGYLGLSINYWRLLVPAPEAGVSVRCEVQQARSHGHLLASPIPSPLENPPTAVDWTLPHLIYMAGLPLPADVRLVRNNDTNQPVADADALRELELPKLDFEDLFVKLSATLRLENPIAMLQSVERRVIKQWLALADRTFIDEVNGFPAMEVGMPPCAGYADTADLSFHDLRGSFSFGSSQRLEFFKRVTAEPRNGITVTLDDTGNLAPALGNLWGEDRPNFAFNNQNFFAALGNIPYGRANSFILTRLSVLAPAIPSGDLFEIDGIPVARAAGRNALTLTLPALDPKRLHQDTWRVFAHELSHNFGLGDEYAEGSRSWTGEELRDPNLTTEATVRDAATGLVHLNRIKWNWHRIRKARVLRRPILLKLNGIFHAYVHKGSGEQFAVGEFVRLRKRERRKVIGADPVTSMVEFRIEAIHPNNVDDSHDILNMTIVLKNESIVVDMDQFGPGSIVYLPIPAPAPSDPFLRPYLTLVPPASERIMAALGGTMTGTTCDVLVHGGAGTQAPFHGDDAVAEKDLPGLVGVYFGGARHACGVLHPTGQCMMRDHHDDASRFCPVCRYVLVEQIDPEQHGLVDRDYDKQYPL